MLRVLAPRCRWALLLSTVFAAACAPAIEDTTAAARAGIDAGNAKLMAAVQAGDAAAAAAAYTANGQVMAPNVPVVTGRDAIADFFQQGIDGGFSHLVLESIEVEGRGDSANEVGRYRIEDGAGAVLDEGKYIVLWRLEDGEWKLHRDLWNSDRVVAVVDVADDEEMVEE